MELNNKFNIDADVAIVPKGWKKGKVRRIWIEKEGIGYDVMYWEDGTRKTEWFFEPEIADLPDYFKPYVEAKPD